MHRRELIRSGLAGIGTLLFSKTTGAVGLTPAPKQWAIFYGSQCGSTKDAAEWINEGLGDIADVIDVDTDPAITDYENIIIGGWIQAGNLVRNVRIFVSDNKSALQPKIKGLFTLCGNNGSPVGNRQINDYLTTQIVELSGVTDKPAQLFNGRSDPDCNNLGITYDNLKKEDCVAFGESILTTELARYSDRKSARAFSFKATIKPVRHAPVIFTYFLPDAQRVTLSVTTLTGRTVAIPVAERQPAGRYRLQWDTKNAATGVYLSRLQVGSRSVSRTLRISDFR